MNATQVTDRLAQDKPPDKIWMSARRGERQYSEFCEKVCGNLKTQSIGGQCMDQVSHYTIS